MNTIQFQTAVKRVSTMADGTLGISLNTQELPPDQMTEMFSLINKHCACVLAPHGEEIEPFDPVTVDVPKSKSPSTRLRGVLYLNWKKNDEGYKDFDQWYKITMEKIITHYKEKLDG